MLLIFAINNRCSVKLFLKFSHDKENPSAAGRESEQVVRID